MSVGQLKALLATLPWLDGVKLVRTGDLHGVLHCHSHFSDGEATIADLAKAAQARGDFQVLAERGRRALRIHFGVDVDRGLAQLEGAIRQALA